MMQLEGRRPVLEALRAGRTVHRVLVSSDAHGTIIGEIVREAHVRGVPVERIAQREVDSKARGRTAQGVIAVVPEFSYAHLDEILDRRPTLLVAVDGVTDPHNVGALARSAEAAGAGGLLLPDRRAAHVTPVVEKAAAGALAHLPVAIVGNLASALSKLSEMGIWIVALDSDATTSLWELPVAEEPLCLVVGSEGTGVSRLIRQRADVVAAIPMRGRVGSLNASVAGAVALFEISRRRS